jgi:ubiquinone/menaquinone biosynthesis C-methylase UbiE
VTQRPDGGSASRPGRRRISWSKPSASPPASFQGRWPGADGAGAGKLEAEEYARIAEVEDDHWWYRNTRALVAELLAPWLGRGQRTLDAGCGPGGNGAWLAAHGTVIGVDIAADALRYVHTNRPATVPAQASLEALPFADRSFDQVVGITVLYTVANDTSAMRELARVLRPGGAAVFVEPAFESLRRGHDTTVHSRRRYRTGELAQLARAAGLMPRRTTYAYSFLVPPAAALSAVDRLRTTTTSESDIERRALDRVFAPMARAERRVLVRHDVPFGTSAILLATRDEIERQRGGCPAEP